MTIMTLDRARFIAAQCNADSTDGWRWEVVELPNGKAKISVRDGDGYLLGWL